MRHVHPLLIAYAHRQPSQLTAAQQRRLWRHLAQCEECRAALAREEQIAREMRAQMPRIGQPAPGQLARLWPAIRQQALRPAPARWVSRAAPLHSPYGPCGMALALALVCVMLSAALFQNAAHGNAAPLQPVPAEVRATSTPIFTEEPGRSAARPTAAHTVAFSALAAPTLPVMSPAAAPAPLLGATVRR